jgi:hypothetical protein
VSVEREIWVWARRSSDTDMTTSPGETRPCAARRRSLQPAHVAADLRLGEPEPQRGPPEVPLLGDGHERPQVLELDIIHAPREWSHAE